MSPKRIKNTIQFWKVTKREEVFRKYSRAIEAVTYKLPNGETTEFFVKKEGPAAAVVALTGDNKIILAKQFRVGPE